MQPGETFTSLSATPSGRGYRLFTSRGRALTFGDVPFLGDMSSTRLNGPVLGSVVTPSGQGYCMVGSDGGVFTFGDARFAGSMGATRLNAPVQSLVPDPDGTGYCSSPATAASSPSTRRSSARWARSGVFTFGSVPFHGSQVVVVAAV